MPRLDEVRIGACSVEFRLHHEVSLLWIQGPCRSSAAIHHELLLFRFLLRSDFLVLLQAKRTAVSI